MALLVTEGLESRQRPLEAWICSFWMVSIIFCLPVTGIDPESKLRKTIFCGRNLIPRYPKLVVSLGPGICITVTADLHGQG